MGDSALAVSLLDAIVRNVIDLFVDKEKGARRSGRPLSLAACVLLIGVRRSGCFFHGCLGCREACREQAER